MTGARKEPGESDHQHRTQPGGAGAQGHQGIHVGRAVAGLLPGADEIVPTAEVHGDEADQGRTRPEPPALVQVGKEAGHLAGHEAEADHAGDDGPLPGAADLATGLAGLLHCGVGVGFLEGGLVTEVVQAQEHVRRVLGSGHPQPPVLEPELGRPVPGLEDIGDLLDIVGFGRCFEAQEKAEVRGRGRQGGAVALGEHGLHRRLRVAAAHPGRLLHQVDGRLDHAGHGEQRLLHPADTTGAVHAEDVDLVGAVRGRSRCHAGAVAGLLHGRGHDLRVAAGDACALFHQVDRGLDHAGNGKDGLFHPTHAAGAVHVVDVQLIAAGRSRAVGLRLRPRGFRGVHLPASCKKKDGPAGSGLSLFLAGPGVALLYCMSPRPVHKGRMCTSSRNG